MPEVRRARDRFRQYVITKDVAGKIKDELMLMAESDPPSDPPKDTFTFSDILRGNFELLESIKSKRHKAEAIAMIFQKYNLNVTPASINATLLRIRKDLQKKEGAHNGDIIALNNQGTKKKARTKAAREITTPVTEKGTGSKIEHQTAGSTLIDIPEVCHPITESNTQVSVDSVNSQNDEIAISANELHKADVTTSSVESWNDTHNTDIIDRDNEPVKPVAIVHAKRKDDF